MEKGVVDFVSDLAGEIQIVHVLLLLLLLLLMMMMMMIMLSMSILMTADDYGYNDDDTGTVDRVA